MYAQLKCSLILSKFYIHKHKEQVYICFVSLITLIKATFILMKFGMMSVSEHDVPAIC
jgi:hypothetical protein